MRRAWGFLAAPGMVRLAAFFLVAFYAVVAVGLGNITDAYDPVPHWNPLDWNNGYLWQAITDGVPGGRGVAGVPAHAAVRDRAVLLSLAIGYPVATTCSRYAAGRSKAALLILLVAPFGISYLMRMFAWTNLLAEGGRGGRAQRAVAGPVAAPRWGC